MDTAVNEGDKSHLAAIARATEYSVAQDYSILAFLLLDGKVEGGHHQRNKNGAFDFLTYVGWLPVYLAACLSCYQAGYLSV